MAHIDRFDTRRCQRLAEIVAVAHDQATTARRSREIARAQRQRAEQIRQITTRRAAELIGLRWRVRKARYDRHGAIVAMWSGEQGPPNTEATISPTGLNRLVNRLFEAGLAITACQTLVDHAVASRLESVTEMLDSVIRDLRKTVFDAHAALGVVQPGPAIDDPPDPGPLNQEQTDTLQLSAVVPILKQTGLTVERLWRLASNDDHGDAAVGLGEASQSLHRALIALDGEPLTAKRP